MSALCLASESNFSWNGSAMSFQAPLPRPYVVADAVLCSTTSHAFVAMPSRPNKSCGMLCASHVTATQTTNGPSHTMRHAFVGRGGRKARIWCGSRLSMAATAAVVVGDAAEGEQQLKLKLDGNTPPGLVQLRPTGCVQSTTTTRPRRHTPPQGDRERDEKQGAAKATVKNSVEAGPSVDGQMVVGDEVIAARQIAFIEEMSLLGKLGHGREVTQAMEWARLQGSPPFNLYMCNACITALARCGRWRQALAVLDGMRQIAPKASADDSLGGERLICRSVRPDVVSYSSAITACGKAGQRRRALALLGDMRVEGVPPNVVSYNAAIHACVQTSGFPISSAEAGLDGAKAGEVVSGSSAGQGWALVLGLMSEMRSKGLAPDVFTYSTAITACGKAGQWERALMLLGEMETGQEKLAPDVISINAAIAACGRAGECDRALELLRRMTSGAPTRLSVGGENLPGDERYRDTGNGSKRSWPRPDVWSFNIAMEACAKAGRWRDGVSLLPLLRRAGIRPDIHSYAAVFSCLRAGGQWEPAVELLDEIEVGVEQGLSPDLGCYGIVLSTLGEAGQWERALALLRRLQSRTSLPPTGSVASSPNSAHGGEDTDTGSAADAAEAGVVSASPTGGPNLICFNAALAACAKAGAWLPAITLLHEMEERGVFDVVSFNSALHACRRQGEWRNAIALLDRMRNSNLDEEMSAGVKLGTPSTTWGNSDAGRAHSGRETGPGLTGRRRIPAPDVYSFTSAITACGAAGQGDRALKLLREMQEAGIPPNVVPFNAAIAAVGRGILHRDPVAATAKGEQPWERARALLGEMRAAGVTPDLTSYNTVLAACHRAGAWKDALEVLTEMIGGTDGTSGAKLASSRTPSNEVTETPLHPDVVSFNTAIGACGRAGRWQEALLLLDEISVQGLVPNRVSYNTAAAACGSVNKWHTALEVLNRGRRAGAVAMDAPSEGSCGGGFSGREEAAAQFRDSDARFYASVAAMVRSGQSNKTSRKEDE